MLNIRSRNTHSLSRLLGHLVSLRFRLAQSPCREFGDCPEYLRLSIRVVAAERMNPPRLLRRAPLDIHDYAVHRADWGEALTAAATELWDNDYIHTVVKDRPELRWASTQTCVAIDAYLHINAQRGRMPFRVTRPRLNPLFTTLRCHTPNRRTVCSCRAQLAAARKPAPQTCAC